MTTTLDTAEREKRVSNILDQIKHELEHTIVGDDMTRAAALGTSLAELAANLIDAAEGRHVHVVGRTAIGTPMYSARGTTTRKVRKALGYTHP